MFGNNWFCLTRCKKHYLKNINKNGFALSYHFVSIKVGETTDKTVSGNVKFTEKAKKKKKKLLNKILCKTRKCQGFNVH